jgi:hypothetical protein
MRGDDRHPPCRKSLSRLCPRTEPLSALPFVLHAAGWRKRIGGCQRFIDLNSKAYSFSLGEGSPALLPWNGSTDTFCMACSTSVARILKCSASFANKSRFHRVGGDLPHHFILGRLFPQPLQVHLHIPHNYFPKKPSFMAG